MSSTDGATRRGIRKGMLVLGALLATGLAASFPSGRDASASIPAKFS